MIRSLGIIRQVSIAALDYYIETGRQISLLPMIVRSAP